MKVRVEWIPRVGVALKSALADQELSFRAKGVLAYLLTLPQGQAVDVTSLLEVSAEKRVAIGTALLELAATGYCNRIETLVDPEETAPPQEGRTDTPPDVPVMDSLFGQSFAPSVKASRRPELRSRALPDPIEQAVRRIVKRMNELRESNWEWLQYRPLEAKYAANVKHIKKRLREGHTEDDLILVLEFRAAVDGGDDKSRRYFNSETPFNTRNFEENLVGAREWDAQGRHDCKLAGPLQAARGHDPEIYEEWMRGGTG